MEISRLQWILFVSLILFAVTAAGAAETVSASVGGDTGYYSIQSSPSGASVTFDGKYVGQSPVVVDVSTTGTPGHTIVINAPNYQTWTQTVQGNPGSGQTISIFAALNPVQPPTGTIYVSSSPQGASAILDGGADSLVTPGTFYNVVPGYHTVKVSMAGYQSYSQQVQVVSGGTASVYANLMLNPQSGSLSVSSTPKGAGLYVDGIYQGETNQIVGGLAVGSHTVTLKLAGYQTYTNTYVVNYAQTTYVSVTMTPVQNPTTGAMTVISSPSGAAVYVNGNYQGITTQGSDPLDVLDLTPGTYTVLLKKNGYQDYTTTAKVTAGQTTQVVATLQAGGGTSGTVSAEISSTPEGADVYINNLYKGVTPLAFQNVPVDTSQTYTIMIKLDGYNPYTTSGTVTPGQYIQINAALSPVPTTPTKSPLFPAIAIVALVSGAFLVFARKKQH